MSGERVLAERVEVFQSKNPSKARFIYQLLLNRGITATIENECRVMVDRQSFASAQGIVSDFTRPPTIWERIVGRRGFSRIKLTGSSNDDGVVWISAGQRSSNPHYDFDYCGCDGDSGGDCGGGDGGDGGD